MRQDARGCRIQEAHHIHCGRRLAAVSAGADVAKLEQKINCGQIEEVIKQAERELALARNMVKWKPWEPLVDSTPADQWKCPLNDVPSRMSPQRCPLNDIPSMCNDIPSTMSPQRCPVLFKSKRIIVDMLLDT